jgi:hypothetical protein
MGVEIHEFARAMLTDLERRASEVFLTSELSNWYLGIVVCDTVWSGTWSRVFRWGLLPMFSLMFWWPAALNANCGCTPAHMITTCTYVCVCVWTRIHTHVTVSSVRRISKIVKSILNSCELMWCYACSWDVIADLTLNSMAQIHTSVTLLVTWSHVELTHQHASHISGVAHISWDVTYVSSALQVLLPVVLRNGRNAYWKIAPTHGKGLGRSWK